MVYIKTYTGKDELSGFGVMLIKKLPYLLSVMAQCTVNEFVDVSNTSLFVRLTACFGSVEREGIILTLPLLNKLRCHAHF